MKHLNRLTEFIRNNFIWSFEDLYPGNCSSKLIGIGSGKSEFVTFAKHKYSTTEGKEGENEKSEGKGKNWGYRMVNSRLAETLASKSEPETLLLKNPSPRQFRDNGANKAIK